MRSSVGFEARRSRRPLEGALEAIVSPKHLFANHEGGRAEDSEADGLLRRSSKGGRLLRRNGLTTHRLRVEPEPREDRVENCSRGDVAVFDKVGLHDLLNEQATPAAALDAE